MRVRLIAVSLAVICAASAAKAQSSGFVYTGPGSFAGQAPDPQTDFVETARIVNGVRSNAVGTIPISEFQPAGQVAPQAAVQPLIADPGIGATTNKLYQGVSLAAAMTLIPPNPGDRFSVSFGSADFAGKKALSGTFAYRVTGRTLLYAGYARSSSEDLAKAGVSFSIH